MKQMKKQMIGSILMIALLLPIFIHSEIAYAANGSTAASGSSEDTIVVVSMGDSYSSGEGIEKFYGQDSALIDKVQDENWLAHRSMRSWPSLLEIPGIDGTLADYNVELTDSTECSWYFVAVSGATTENFYSKQEKTVDKIISYSDKSAFKKLVASKTAENIDASLSLDLLEGRYRYEAVEYLPAQLDIFDEIEYGTVDYVTLTVGGNDLDFSGVIETAATGTKEDFTRSVIASIIGSNYVNYSGLEAKLDDSRAKLYSETRYDLKELYEDIAEKAGPQAAILVAGYPKLLDEDGGGIVFSRSDAELINSSVEEFNEVLEAIVEECREEGLNIYYVDVQEAFEGHEAYSDDAWINPVYLKVKSEDIDTAGIISSYSVHPNATGAKKGYAACVNAKIAEIEAEKNTCEKDETDCLPPDQYTVFELYNMSFSEIQKLSWDTCETANHSTDDSYIEWTCVCTYGDETVTFWFWDFAYLTSNAGPAEIEVDDGQKGALNLPVTSKIYTGMTCSEFYALTDEDEYFSQFYFSWEWSTIGGGGYWLFYYWDEMWCYIDLYFGSVNGEDILQTVRITYLY